MASLGDELRQRATRHARAHDVISILEIVGAVLLCLFLVLFVAALIPWLLAGAVTAGAESLMRQVGFDDFDASTLADWTLVLFVGLMLTVLMTVIVAAITFCVSFLARRAGVPLVPRALRRTALGSGVARAALPPGNPAAEPDSREELYAEAQRLDIPGRSKMSKAELRRAVARAR
jgi:hypothetical protein